jgi:hypothetical protein
MQRCSGYGLLDHSGHNTPNLPFHCNIPPGRLHLAAFFFGPSRAVFGSVDPEIFDLQCPSLSESENVTACISINHTAGVSCFQISAHRVQARVRKWLSLRGKLGARYVEVAYWLSRTSFSGNNRLEICLQPLKIQEYPDISADFQNRLLPRGSAVISGIDTRVKMYCVLIYIAPHKFHFSGLANREPSFVSNPVLNGLAYSVAKRG